MKCCNVIKSCAVAPDHTEGEGSVARGLLCIHSDPRDAHEIAATGKACANMLDMTEANMPLSDGSDETVGVAKFAPSHAMDTDDNTMRERGRGVNDIVGTPDVDSLKAKAKPVQRKNLFVDETVASFFRRLSWSPDGAFLITPTSQNWDAAARKTQFCTYIFARGQFVR